jgi:hypothetical protein
VKIIREFGFTFGLIETPLVLVGFYEGILENFQPRMWEILKFE